MIKHRAGTDDAVDAEAMALSYLGAGTKSLTMVVIITKIAQVVIMMIFKVIVIHRDHKTNHLIANV